MTAVKTAPKGKNILTANVNQLSGQDGYRGPKPVEITDQQSALWAQTRTRFMWDAPGFTHILYKLMSPNVPGHVVWVDDPEIPTAGTDGLYVYANRDWYFKLPLPARTFVLGHEVLHAVFNHPVIFHGWRTRGKVTLPNGTVLPYDEKTMQHAADYIINAILLDSKIGKPPEGENKALLDPSFIPHTTSLVDAYAKVYKANPPGKGGGGKNGKGKGGKGDFDSVLMPGKGQGKTPGQAKSDRNDQEWKTTVAAAMASQKARGLMSASLQHAFGEILTPKVSWEEYIIGWFKKKLGSGSWNFRRPDRRFISRDPMLYAPSRQGFGAQNVVIGVDTSGSIGPEVLDRFFAEMAGILGDVRPQRVWVVWCDAKVHRVDEVEDIEDLFTVRAKGAPGRGGTAFEPVFEKVKQLGFVPDALVYLTDGLGSFPQHAPSYPVLWGDIHGKVKFPFGEVVKVPV